MCSHGHSAVTWSAASWYQTSRPGSMSTAPPVRLTTMTWSTPPTFAIAASVLALSGTLRPARSPSSAVMTTLELAVLDAAGERIRREAAEHDGMDGADARAGEDRVGRFRNHRHVDGDAIALLDVAVAQHVGEAADFVVQFAKGDFLGFFRIVAFPDDGDLVTARMQMPVDAIVGGVGDAVLEPFDRDVRPWRRMYS